MILVPIFVIGKLVLAVESDCSRVSGYVSWVTIRGGYFSLGAQLCAVGTLALWASGCKSNERAPVLEPLEAGERVDCTNLPEDRLPETTSAFEESHCLNIVEGHEVQRGTVTVPVAPGSEETIELAVVRVFSNASQVKADPIVYLDGGPGGPSLEGVSGLYPFMRGISEDRDFIYIDQRGVGLSKPDLQCYETEEDIFEAIGACFDRLSGDIDLNEVNTANNAHDIDQVRQAFGYDEWNLLGVSYGTRLALTVMRDYPQGVRSSLIDSVVPLQRDVLAEVGINGYQAIVHALDACAANDKCARTYPDPMGQLTALVDELNESPGGEDQWISGDTFVRFVFEFLYTPTGVGAVPLLIDDATRDDFSLFEGLASGGTSGSGLSFGMHLSLHCSEETPFSTRAQFREFDRGIPPAFRPALTGADYLDWCEYWPVEPAPAIENEPVVSDLPTLVLAGEFDPITPPAFAEAAHEFLENSTYVLIENESHGAVFSECGFEMARQFFDDPELPVSTSCLNDASGIEWQSISPVQQKNALQKKKRIAEQEIDFKTEPLSEHEIEELREQLRLRVR